ncbi:hypothetical protein NNL61_00620 [Enterococcus faecium]|nr:hypothetical protein [Enterococcus faecium]
MTFLDLFAMKRIKGRGYVDTGGSAISEFYTPLVPKEYDFLYQIKKVVKDSVILMYNFSD